MSCSFVPESQWRLCKYGKFVLCINCCMILNYLFIYSHQIVVTKNVSAVKIKQLKMKVLLQLKCTAVYMLMKVQIQVILNKWTKLHERRFVFNFYTVPIKCVTNTQFYMYIYICIIFIRVLIWPTCEF